MTKRSKKLLLEKQKHRRTTKTENVASAEITIEISLRSPRVADTVYASLLPETLQPSGFRSRTTISRNGRIIRLNIEAEDVVALRAASNSFLRFTSVAIKTLDIVSPFYSAGDRDFDLKITGKSV